MKKLTKTLLHLWITVIATGAFVSGWAFIAHAQKPAPLVQPEVQINLPSQPVLEPIPSIDDFLSSEVRPAPVLQQPSMVFPRLRTGGS